WSSDVCSSDLSVAKGADELWVGVTCQANREIAGSPRNGFWASLARWPSEVEHWIGAGAHRLPTRTKLRMPVARTRGSETAGAKLRRREGNSPDRRLRSPSVGSVGKEVRARRQPGGWLRSSHP